MDIGRDGESRDKLEAPAVKQEGLDMKRCICAALALVFLLTLCACGKTGTGSGSAVGGTSSVENIFEQLVQEKTNIEAFS